MSRRTSIIKAIVASLKVIGTSDTYKTVGLEENVYSKLKFWDEVNNFPSIYVVPGTEVREYHPAGFRWGFLNVCIKAYTKDAEDSAQLLEDLLEDIEEVITSSDVIVYDVENNYSTTEITITSITTDEGLLAPYGVGELNLLVRYQIM